MLPMTSSSPRRRGNAATSSAGRRSRWPRVALALAAGVLCIFFWMQYTILSTNLGGLAARAHTTAHTKQGPTAIMRASNPTVQRVGDHDNDDGNDSNVHADGGTPIGFDALNRQHPALRTNTQPAATTAAVNTTAAATSTVAAVSPAEQAHRRTAVVDAMRFAWSNYEKFAFGADEVNPQTGKRKQNVWGDIAVSLVDGIDTLFVMGLDAEFKRARAFVATSLSFDHLGKDGTKVSIFETIIREVGGLLSAFALSNDVIFKLKAQELMDLLTPAFEEAEGVYYTLFNPHTKQRSFASWAGYRAHIADVGTLQLESRYLSDITGDPKYARMGDAFYKILQREGSFNHSGLFPVHLNAARGTFDKRSVITFGALGDSFYEYLLKVYLYSGELESDMYLRQFYDAAVDGLAKHLLAYSEPDGLYYLRELVLPSLSHTEHMEHLVCFVPGMLALGTLSTQNATNGTIQLRNANHLELATKLMETCVAMYLRQPTSLSPDSVTFPHMKPRDPSYKLRPEAIESLFYLYRVTNDVRYRTIGWQIFQAVEKHAKLPFGYGAVRDVTRIPPTHENKMESFFLAETLKYHYLLQSPNDVLPLDEWVFNTEAHPLRMRKRQQAPQEDDEDKE